MIALALALLASSQTAGPDMFDVFLVQPGGRQQLFRERLKGDRAPSAQEMVTLGPAASAAALREERGFRILPGEARIAGARAVAFSPDGQRIAAALASGKIVATNLQGQVSQELGRMHGVRKLAWGLNVIAAGPRGAVLLPNRLLTAANVKEIAVWGDRTAIATSETLLLFDGSGNQLLRLKVKAAMLAFSQNGALAYAAGREVWLVDGGLKPSRIAAEKAPITAIAFAGETVAWLANGAHRADGKHLDCARALAPNNHELIATCHDRAVAWDGDTARTLYTANDCNVSMVWTLPLGAELLIATRLRDRRFLPTCELMQHPLGP